MSRINLEVLDDAVQDAFLKAYLNIEKFDESKSSIRTWICTIARNVCADRFRSNVVRLKREVAIEDKHLEILEKGWVHDKDELESEIDYDLYPRELSSRWNGVLRGLRTLNEDELKIISLRFYNGMKFKDIAIKMRKSNDSVRQLSSRVIKKLRTMALSYNG